jgi:hypothetical protein
MHEIDGMDIKDKVFEIKVPFQNKSGSDLIADHIKRPDLVLNGVKLSAPFELVDVHPDLPINVPYMSKAEVIIHAAAPDVKYSGPLTIEFLDRPEAPVRIGITKISLLRKNKIADIEESATILKAKKGQIFKRDFQLYSVVNYMDFVEEISVNKPFSIAGTDPNTPFQISTKDSFIISVLIKMPDFDYTGPLELHVE